MTAFKRNFLRPKEVATSWHCDILHCDISLYEKPVLRIWSISNTYEIEV